jgi:hypothetical protein
MPGQPCCSGFFFAYYIFESKQPDHKYGSARYVNLEMHQKSGARGRI